MLTFLFLRLFIFSGDFDKALESHHRAFEIQRTISDVSPNLAIALNGLGNIYCRKNCLDRALEFYGEALVVENNILPFDSIDVASLNNNIGNIAFKQGNLEKASEAYKEALRIERKCFLPNSAELVSTLKQMALVLYKRNEMEKALDLYQEVLQIQKSLLPADC